MLGQNCLHYISPTIYKEISLVNLWVLRFPTDSSLLLTWRNVLIFLWHKWDWKTCVCNIIRHVLLSWKFNDYDICHVKWSIHLLWNMTRLIISFAVIGSCASAAWVFVCLSSWYLLDWFASMFLQWRPRLFQMQKMISVNHVTWQGTSR